MPAELTVTPPEIRLTRKQEAFALEIASNPRLTHTECARRAGCPETSAKVTACRWLKMPVIKAEIERLQNEILEQEGVSRFSILRELAAIVHSNLKEMEEAISKGGLAALSARHGAALKKIKIEEFEETPEKQGSTLEEQPQGGALQRGGDSQEPARPKLRRRIELELLPKTPALELLGKNMNLWGAGVDADTPPGMNQFI